MKYLDVYSSAPELLVQGNARYSTTVGTFISIIASIACITLGIWFFQEWITTTKSQIIKNEASNENINLDISSFPIMFGVFNGNLKSFPDERRLFTTEVVTHDFRDGKIVNIPVNKCNKETDFGKYKQSFSSTPDLETYWCIPPDRHNLTLFSSYGSSVNFKYLNINIKKCKNGTSIGSSGDFLHNITDCYPTEHAEKVMSDVFLKFQHVDFQVDHDLKEPFKPQEKSFLVGISLKLFKRFFITIDIINYITDVGIMMKE
jgi:hypothetical protein